MNACPECDNPLPQTATSCRCGWTLPVAPPDLKTREDLLAEDLEKRTASALAWMEANGLGKHKGESDADWRRRSLTWMKERIGKIGKAA